MVMYSIQDQLIRDGFSWKAIAYVFCPDLFLRLPTSYLMLVESPDLMCSLDLLLSSFNVSCSDFYRSDGILDRSALVSYDYTRSSDFLKYTDKVDSDLVNFDKSRYVNSFLNVNF